METTTSAPTTSLQKCSICGADTEWDDSYREDPICVSCWDARAGKDNKVAARMRAYYQAHREEVAARKRAHYQAHREEAAARMRAYYQAHREEVAARKRAYYQAHREVRR